MFQTLFAGKTLHDVPGTSAAEAGIADGPDHSIRVAAHSPRIFFTPAVSAAGAVSLSGSVGGRRGGRQLLRLRDQTRDELRLGDLVDDLAFHDEEPLALACRDPQIGF